ADGAAEAGDGADSALVDAATAEAPGYVMLQQYAHGGDGGNQAGNAALGGAAGNGISSLHSDVGAASAQILSNAYGGAGGSGRAGGDARASGSARAQLDTRAYAFASGGKGGAGSALLAGGDGGSAYVEDVDAISLQGGVITIQGAALGG